MCVHCLQAIASQKAVGSAQQSSVQHETTGPYALPKETVDKDQGVARYLYNY